MQRNKKVGHIFREKVMNKNWESLDIGFSMQRVKKSYYKYGQRTKENDV